MKINGKMSSNIGDIYSTVHVNFKRCSALQVITVNTIANIISNASAQNSIFQNILHYDITIKTVLEIITNILIILLTQNNSSRV